MSMYEVYIRVVRRGRARRGDEMPVVPGGGGKGMTNEQQSI